MPYEVGYISAEGGPLLIADAEVVRSWRGVEGGDYERASALFDADSLLEGGVLSIAGSDAVLWEMRGPGTAHVLAAKLGEVLLVRMWPKDDLGREADRALRLGTALAESSQRIGSFRVSSGFIAILWAAESGDCICDHDYKHAGRPSGEMAMDDAGLLVKVPPGRYECWHEAVETELAVARRCRVFAVA